MQIEKLHRKTLFEHNRGSRILGTISFEQPDINDKDKKIRLLIIYSRIQVLVYKLSSTKKSDPNHLKPHFLIKKTLYGSIKSLVKLANSRRKKPIFSILFRSGRVCTFNVDLQHNFLQILAMHELNTKEVLSMERNAPNTAKLKFSVKSDINNNGICVLRSRCIFSFHLVSNYAKQFGLEGKVFHNGAVMLVQDLVQKSETFGNSLHIDLRIFTLDNVSDFNFICHPTHISLYMIAAIPSYLDKKVKSIDKKLIEVKITPVLLQKMKNIKSNHDIVHNIKIKEHITSFNFLPKDVYKFFLMKNYGILVATSKGIFYINGWILLLTFDRNSANEYLTKIPNIQVQYTKISLENVFESLKNANYKFEEDQLSIEFPNQFVTLDFEFSPFDPKKCNQVHVSNLQKNKYFDLQLLDQSKTHIIGKKSHCLKLFRVTTARVKKEDTRDHKKDLQRFSIVEAFNSKVFEKETVKIMNNFDSFNDMCTIRKNSRFDFTLTSMNGGDPYLINGMKGIKARVLKVLNLGSKKAFLISEKKGESSSFNFFVQCVKQAVKIVSVEPDSDSMFMNLLENVAFEKDADTVKSFDMDDTVMLQVTRNSLLVVNKRYLNLSSFRYEFNFEVKNCYKIKDRLFLLDTKGDVHLLRLGKSDKDEYEVEDLTNGANLKDVNLDFISSFNVLSLRKDHDRYLVTSNAANIVRFYYMRFDKETKEIAKFELKAQFICTQAGYMLRNTAEMNSDQLEMIRKNSYRKTQSEYVNFDRSITEPCWKLDLVMKRDPSCIIQEIFSTNLGDTLIIIIKYSTEDIAVYRSLFRFSSPEKLKDQIFVREAIPFPTSSNLQNLKNLKIEELDQEGEETSKRNQFLMSVSKINIKNKNKVLVVSGMGLRPFVITQKYGLFYFHSINLPKNSIINYLNQTKFLCTNPDSLSLALVDIYFPAMLNYHFPCDVYEISGKPMRVFNINKNGKNCLLLWVVKKFQDHLELYSMDSSFKKIDYVAFNSEDKITAIKSVFIAYQMKEYDETLAVMYITKQAQGFYSKWMLLRLNCDSDPKGKENTRLRVGEVNIDQEGNELITCTFSVDGNLFVCIGNRILQMSFITGAKMARTYYPNMSYVVDAAVSNNSVALCNIRGRVILLVWIEEQKKLIQRACYNIDNCLLREISFLDNEQAKLVCTDSSGKLYLLSVFSGKSEGEINLKTINVINLGSNSVNIVSREDSKGVDLALIDGSIMSLRSCKIQGQRLLQTFMNLYDFVSSQIPHSLGLHPKNQANLLVIDRISFEHLSKKELINLHALNSFLGLSFPLQKCGLKSIGAHRSEINDVFNC